MLEEGIRGDTISYTAMINACARVGDADKAEEWLVRMLKDGVEPNVITFNAVIAACAKKGCGDRTEMWLNKMKRAGVPPNSFSYNSAAKPFVTTGDWKKVEQLMTDLRNDGQVFDDFCLTSLLHAYANTKPKHAKRAQAAFMEFAIANPKEVSASAMGALQRVVGAGPASAIFKSCGLDRVEGKGSRGKGNGKGKA